MKSKQQVLSLLHKYQPISHVDSDMIIGFLKERYNITPTTQVFSNTHTERKISASAFLKWLENGYSASDIVRYRDSILILGQPYLTESEAIGEVNNYRFKTCKTIVSHKDLSKANMFDKRTMLALLADNQLQYNPITMKLTHKYFPKNRDKIIFHSQDYSKRGIGVVRNFNPETNDIELYCYYIYPDINGEDEIGFSMHEKGIVNFTKHIVEPMLGSSDDRVSSLNGPSCYRRLHRELNKVGKIWKDALGRIEPLEYEVKEGEPYWYIDDKLSVVKKIEKCTPTSKKRYLAGNYFITYESALNMLSKIRSIINDFLASSNWPEINE